MADTPDIIKYPVEDGKGGWTYRSIPVSLAKELRTPEKLDQIAKEYIARNPTVQVDPNRYSYSGPRGGMQGVSSQMERNHPVVNSVINSLPPVAMMNRTAEAGERGGDPNVPGWRKALGGVEDTAANAMDLVSLPGIIKAGIWPSLKAIAGYTGASVPLEKGTEALGAPPEISRGVGMLGGLAGGTIVAGGSPRINEAVSSGAEAIKSVPTAASRAIGAGLFSHVGIPWYSGAKLGEMALGTRSTPPEMPGYLAPKPTAPWLDPSIGEFVTHDRNAGPSPTGMFSSAETPVDTRMNPYVGESAPVQPAPVKTSQRPAGPKVDYQEQIANEKAAAARVPDPINPEVAPSVPEVMSDYPMKYGRGRQALPPGPERVFKMGDPQQFHYPPGTAPEFTQPVNRLPLELPPASSIQAGPAQAGQAGQVPPLQFPLTPRLLQVPGAGGPARTQGAIPMPGNVRQIEQTRPVSKPKIKTSDTSPVESSNAYKAMTAEDKPISHQAIFEMADALGVTQKSIRDMLIKAGKTVEPSKFPERATKAELQHEQDLAATLQKGIDAVKASAKSAPVTAPKPKSAPRLKAKKPATGPENQ